MNTTLIFNKGCSTTLTTKFRFVKFKEITVLKKKTHVSIVWMQTDNLNNSRENKNDSILC